MQQSAFTSNSPQAVPPTQVIFVAPEGWPQPEIMVGPFGFYTTHQLAGHVGVPEYHFRRIVQDEDSGLNGQKVGKQYLISADQFKQWVESGNFKYKPRPRARKRDLQLDLADNDRRNADRKARSF